MSYANDGSAVAAGPAWAFFQLPAQSVLPEVTLKGKTSHTSNIVTCLNNPPPCHTRLINSQSIVTKIGLAKPKDGDCKIDIGSHSVNDIEHNIENARQRQIDISKKIFISKLCNLASVGALSLLQLAQFMHLKEKDEINIGTAMVGFMALGVATADCAAALVDYLCKKGGKEGLAMGANSLAGVVHWVVKKMGKSDETAEKCANTLSVVARTGLMVTQLVQSFGNMTVQNINKVLTLPESVTRFAVGLSGNVSDAALKSIPWTKIVFEQIAGVTQGIAKGKEREADKLAGIQSEQKYRLDSEEVVKAHGIATTLSMLGKAVAHSTGSRIAQAVSTVLNVINGAGKTIEGHAKRLQNAPLIGKFV